MTLAAATTIGNAVAVGNLTIAGVVSGAFDLTKVGPGSLTLTNANTWTGATTVMGGTLTLTNTNAYAGATTNLLKYTANGVAAFTNYVAQNFAAAGTLAATTATDLVMVTATGGTASYTLTATAGQQVGALVFAYNNTGFVPTLVASGTFPATAGVLVLTGTNNAGGGNTALGGAAGNSFVLPAAGSTANFSGETFLYGDKSGNTNRVDGSLVGTGTLVAAGVGSVNLARNRAATYSGGTFVSMANSGLRFFVNGGNSNIGSGPVMFNAARVNVNAGVSAVLANPVTFTGYTDLAVNAADANLVFTGPITLAGPGALAFVGSTNVGNYVVSLTNTTNDYAGGTALTTNTGVPILSLAAGNVLGTGPLAMTGGNIVATAPLTIANQLILAGNSPTVTGSSAPVTFTGPAAVFAGSTFTANNVAGVTLSGVITDANGPQTLTFSGTQTVTLAGANGVNAVVTSMGGAAGAGTLAVGTASALGAGTLPLTAGVCQTTAGSSTIVNNVAPNSNNTPVVFAGTPATFTGTVSQTGVPLVLAAGTTTFAGAVNGNVAFTLSGAPVVAALTTGGTATNTPTGTLTLTGTNSSTSTVTVNGGTLVRAGNGALAAVSGVTVNPGGTLTLDNTGTNSASRVNDAATVTLNGGTLTYLGNGAAAPTELLGALTCGPEPRRSPARPAPARRPR